MLKIGTHLKVNLSAEKAVFIYRPIKFGVPLERSLFFLNQVLMVMNILVSNLSSNIIADYLITLFSVYGTVSFAAIVRDKKSGRSKGRAFLEMPHEAQGEQAILALNHSLLDGMEMEVQEIIYKPGEFNN